MKKNRGVILMAKQKDHKEHHYGIGSAAEWLDDRLLPILGPPALGPYDAPSTIATSDRACPICGRALREHEAELDPGSGHIFLHHPDASIEGVLETGRPH
jgi:hypothetical protein